MRTWLTAIRTQSTSLESGRTDLLTVVPIAPVSVLHALNHKAVKDFITMMDQLQGSGVSTWGRDSRRYMTKEVIWDLTSTFRYASYHDNQGTQVMRHTDPTPESWLTLSWPEHAPTSGNDFSTLQIVCL